MKMKINGDLLGIGTSIACAIHCAVLPLFLSGISFMGINILELPAFEYGMIALAFVIGVHSLRHGFRRHHRSYVPFLLFCSGMLFLLAKQYWHYYELYLLPFAVLFIITAHVANFRYIRATSKKKACGAPQAA